MSVLAFTDGNDGYYEFAQDAPASWYAHLIPTTKRNPLPAPLPSAAEQIEALERETLLPRPVRDFMLISMEQAAAEQGATQGLTPTQSIAILRANNSGYRKVKELDEQIAALRNLL